MDGVRKGMSVLLVASLALSAHAARPRLADPAMEVRKVDPSEESSAPVPGSARAQALTALAGAQEITLSSLQPWSFPHELEDVSDVAPAKRNEVMVERLNRSRSQWCESADCFHATRVLGRTQIAATDMASMRALLRDVLGIMPPYASACIPEYHHALSFADAGSRTRYDILLCYQCAQVLVVVDGKERELGAIAPMGGQRMLDAILTRAGVPLAQRKTL